MGKEVQAFTSSIVDRAQSNPAIDPTAFPLTTSTYYWSSTVTQWSASSAWYVGFNLGYSNISGMTYTYRVRCVR